ncbi:uncharacterized protein MAM_07293 [Metarhizium album ARSEF 1941]|uniref:Phosphoglycerate mutase family protein n=1 Tax=Metarhizium album (strain ARSEF 1941) TaxID=1081103 RepID=A0A0B2WMG9_METAS|nr:uncharacterized protein MAM_07293 [Metarhizium album ARSEF 1941]KHN94874.1 hypothetical protein MAM_07293 [Metarhizium album ARSEF 1941]
MKAAYILSLVTGIAAAEPMVFLIRHGEKPADDGQPGLSAQGKQRAQCLTQVFGPESNYHVGYILAQAYKPDGSRKRPFDTVSPLTQRLGLTVDVSCDRDDSKCVRKAVQKYKGPGNILICWEHKALSDIAEELGADSAPKYPKKRFDEIWIDPWPYSQITDIVSENCPGLDD